MNDLFRAAAFAALAAMPGCAAESTGAGLSSRSGAPLPPLGGLLAGVTQREGESSVVPKEVLRVRWRRLLTEPAFLEYKPQEFASAASDGTRVYVGSRGGHFYALSGEDGTILWRRAIDAGVAARPLFLAELRLGDELNPPRAAAGVVFVGGSDGVLYALDAATGKERWTFRTRGPIQSTPVFADGALYFTNGENRLYAVDARTGTWRWQYEREVPESFTIRGASGPLVVGNRVYAGFADGYAVALDAKNGEVVWARALGGDGERFLDVDSTPTLVDGTLYVSSYAAGVYALDPADGTIRWRHEAEGAGSVRVMGDRLYFAAVRDGVHCLDTRGRVLWRQALVKQGELSAPVLLEDRPGGAPRYLMVSASGAGTYVIDAMSGALVQFFNPGHGVTSEPTSDGQQIYVLTNTGFLYAFALRGSAG